MGLTIWHIGPARIPLLHPTTGAIERRMLWLARKQAARGHQVTVFSTGTERQTITTDGFALRVIPPPPLYHLPGTAKDWALLRSVAALARNRRIDIFHGHSVPEASLLTSGRKAASVLSYDHFDFRKGTKTPLYHLTRRFLQGFDMLLPVSEPIRAASAKYWLLDPAHMSILPNGVDTTLFCQLPSAASQFRARIGLGPSDFVLLWFGRVNHLKGVDLLTEAFTRLRPEFKQLRLLVVGPPDMFGKSGDNTYTRMVAAAGGLYLPAVGEQEAPIVLSSADIFVYPSRNEPFGMAAVEAMACGVSTLCSDIGGLGAIARAAGTPVFRPGDIQDLITQLRRLISDVALRRAVAERGHFYARSYDWDLVTTSLDRLYLEALIHRPAALNAMK